MRATLRVIAPGVLTTVQDGGRMAAQRYGVPCGGAMDRFALAAANRLVGGSAADAVLEITSGGALFELLVPTIFALAGADLGATLDGCPIAPWRTAVARRGALLQLAGRRGAWGARAYLALAGGFDLPLLLGSRSTYLPGGFGGLEGRPLRAGDLLSSLAAPTDFTRLAGRGWPTTARPGYSALPTLRLLPGPHSDCFAADALEQLTTATLRISTTSNRIGYRLEGVKTAHIRPCSLPSLGVFPGVVQVPPDGVPILLMADAQTTGGYPILGIVIEPDLPLAAQLLPGDQLRFIQTTPEDARTAHQHLAACLAKPLAEDDTILMIGLAGS